MAVAPEQPVPVLARLRFGNGQHAHAVVLGPVGRGRHLQGKPSVRGQELIRRSPPPGATPGGGGGLRPSPAQHNQLCCQLQARPSLRSVLQRRLPQHKAASPPLIAPSAAPEALNGPAAVHSVFKQPVDERRRVLSLQPFKHGCSGDGARCGCNKAVSSVRLVCPGSAGPGECASLHGRRAGGPLG